MNSDTKKTLQTISKVFMVVGCILNALFLIPLIWCVPMTVIYFRKLKNEEPIGLAFKICCLLFVSTISGVIMLIEDEIK